MRRCCSTHATNPRRSKCRGQTRSSWMWATFQRTCHGQTFRLLSCSLFSSVCLRRSFVLTIMDLPGGVRCFLTSARTMPMLRRQSRGRGRSQTLACISRGARMHEQACKDVSLRHRAVNNEAYIRQAPFLSLFSLCSAEGTLPHKAIAH